MMKTIDIYRNYKMFTYFKPNIIIIIVIIIVFNDSDEI